MQFLRLDLRLFFFVGSFPTSFRRFVLVATYLILLHIDLFANQTTLEEISTCLALWCSSRQLNKCFLNTNKFIFLWLQSDYWFYKQKTERLRPNAVFHSKHPIWDVYTKIVRAGSTICFIFLLTSAAVGRVLLFCMLDWKVLSTAPREKWCPVIPQNILI